LDLKLPSNEMEAFAQIQQTESSPGAFSQPRSVKTGPLIFNTQLDSPTRVAQNHARLVDTRVFDDIEQELASGIEENESRLLILRLQVRSRLNRNTQ